MICFCINKIEIGLQYTDFVHSRNLQHCEYLTWTTKEVTEYPIVGGRSSWSSAEME